jgi:glutathione S-transferase
MYLLYGGKFTRALLVEMVMAEGGIAYELRNLDIAKREQLSPAFLAINPAGWVPALITPEGDKLYETPAINLYLAERHGLTELAPEVGDPVRGLFLSGLFYLTNHLEAALKRYWYPHRYGAGEEGAPEIKAKACEDALDCLKVIDRRLAAYGPFHLGQRFSLVDLTMTYWSASFEKSDGLEDLPAVRHCAARVTERPKLKPLFDKQKRWIEELYKLRAARGRVR